MFGFLKDKLKSAIRTFSKSAEPDIKEQKIEAPIQKEKTPKQNEKPEIKKEREEVPKKVEEKKATPVAKKPELKIETKPEPKKIIVQEKKKEEKKEEKLPEKKDEKIPEVKHIPKILEKEITKEPVKPIEKKSEVKKDNTAHENSEDKSRLAVKPDFTPIRSEAKASGVPETSFSAHAGGKSQTPPAVENLRDNKKTELKEIKKEEPKKVEEKPKEEKKGFFGKLFGKRDEKPKEEKVTEKNIVEKKPEPVVETEDKLAEEIAELEEEQEESEEEKTEEEIEQEEPEDKIEEPVEEKKGFFGKLTEAFTKKTLTPEKFDELFWELEVAMLENNVAVEVIEKIKFDLRDELTTGKVSRAGLEDAIKDRLRKSIEELFDVEQFDLIQKIKSSQKPYKICIIGVNGSGKTTTLAKIIYLLQQNKLSVVVAASDTFRAAAIDQLKEHTDKLGVKLISQGYNADPAAVAFDAIEHAKAKGIDVVLIDTAGRLHSNTNLMQELEKVVRVNKPDLKLFIGEAITGNDCVEQATVFNKLVGIDAIILSKADVDEKGGAAISVSFVTGKPILYFGVGQRYEDLVPFDKEKIIESLDL